MFWVKFLHIRNKAIIHYIILFFVIAETTSKDGTLSGQQRLMADPKQITRSNPRPVRRTLNLIVSNHPK